MRVTRRLMFAMLVLLLAVTRVLAARPVECASSAQRADAE